MWQIFRNRCYELAHPALESYWHPCVKCMYFVCCFTKKEQLRCFNNHKIFPISYIIFWQIVCNLKYFFFTILNHQISFNIRTCGLEWYISYVLSGTLQSLTISKMRKKYVELKTVSVPNTCCTKNSWSSGIMSNFFGGQLFYVLGGKKNLNFLLKNIAASTLKSCIN